MITAVDTNVLLDLLRPNERYVESSALALEEAAGAGLVVICDIAYAELCVHFRSQRECDAFLDEAAIRVEPLSRSASFLVSRVWRTYRRQGGRRDRILADFLIGAHAQEQASRLVCRDRGFYREMFPSLDLLDPSADIGP